MLIDLRRDLLLVIDLRRDLLLLVIDLRRDLLLFSDRFKEGPVAL